MDVKFIMVNMDTKQEKYIEVEWDPLNQSDNHISSFVSSFFTPI